MKIQTGISIYALIVGGGAVFIALFVTAIAVYSIQPHQGKVTGVASYICCLGRQHFAIQFSDGTTVDCGTDTMSASDIIVMTNLKVGDNVSMFGTCHDVKVSK